MRRFDCIRANSHERPTAGDFASNFLANVEAHAGGADCSAAEDAEESSAYNLLFNVRCWIQAADVHIEARCNRSNADAFHSWPGADLEDGVFVSGCGLSK